MAPPHLLFSVNTCLLAFRRPPDWVAGSLLQYFGCCGDCPIKNSIIIINWFEGKRQTGKV